MRARGEPPGSPHGGPIRALTVRQPWATMIACGIKTLEIRSWSTRYRGDLLIHAAAQPDPPFRRYVAEHPTLPLATIVAIVELADVRPTAPEDGPAAGIMAPSWWRIGWNEVGHKLWAWELRHPRRLVWYPAHGRQGLWRPSAELVESLTVLPPDPPPASGR